MASKFLNFKGIKVVLAEKGQRTSMSLLKKIESIVEKIVIEASEEAEKAEKITVTENHLVKSQKNKDELPNRN